MKKLPTFIAVLLIVVSCKKKTTTEELPSTNCRVKQVTTTTMRNGQETGKSTTSYTYNADGTVAKMFIVDIAQSSTRAIRYDRFNSSVVRQISFKGSEFKVLDTMKLNAQGRIVEKYIPSNIAGLGQWEFYSYDNAGQVAEVKTYNSDTLYGATDTVRIVYYWKDGSIERTGDYSNCEYYDTVYNVGVTNITLDDLDIYG